MVEFEHEGADAVVAGGVVDGVDEVFDAGFRWGGWAAEESGDATGLADFIDEEAAGSDFEGAALGYGDALFTAEDGDADKQEQKQEEDVGEHPAQPGDGSANSAKKATNRAAATC